MFQTYFLPTSVYSQNDSNTIYYKNIHTYVLLKKGMGRYINLFYSKDKAYNLAMAYLESTNR
jgi:hypothetical protein